MILKRLAAWLTRLLRRIFGIEDAMQLNVPISVRFSEEE